MVPLMEVILARGVVKDGYRQEDSPLAMDQ
jgi:hypothetical protein